MNKYVERDILEHMNLRKLLRDDLIDPILGEYYFNKGVDNFDQDRITIRDLKARYDAMKMSITIANVSLIISITMNVLMLILKCRR